MGKGREIKPHIGIFGRRNVGKSSIINVITGQDVAIVSSHPGTTTDPVKKSIEIFGIGPAIIIDTAGIDDSGEVGMQRINKSKQVIKAIDMALLVISDNQFNHFEENLMDEFYENGIPCLIIHNKTDISALNPELAQRINQQYNTQVIEFSAKHPENLDDLIDAICKTMPETAYRQQSLLGDFLSKGDIVLLIVPIDTEAPEGRLILPQVQAIRDILDNNCVAVVLKENEVENFLKNTAIKPKIAICDSSVFDKVDGCVPKEIPLTGFSILLARYKGEFGQYLQGTPEIGRLKDNDRVLILESCTHHVSCDDIGRYKIPRWLEHFTGKKLIFDVVAGLNRLEKPITDYSLVIQCGGCVITRKQLVNRLKPAIDNGIPVTNYGMAIAYMQGVYERAIEPFTKDNCKAGMFSNTCVR
jgi:[FeFe] hydrogenase H-cluster maturation GTPase HydF